MCRLGKAYKLQAKEYYTSELADYDPTSRCGLIELIKRYRRKQTQQLSPVVTSWSCCSCRACSFSKSFSDTTWALLPVPLAEAVKRPLEGWCPSSRRCSRCRYSCCPNYCPFRLPRWTSCPRPQTCHY